ncbi:MAG: hypothetical protein OXI16_12600 [Chloroflexota bacterium]|nr:hypothetical protein [Chloroflexota bacterium]
MWQALGIVSFLVGLAAFIGIIVGLIVGIARKRWKVLRWSTAACGVSLVLLIVAVAMDTRSDEPRDTGTTSATISGPVATAQPQPTATPIPTFDDYKANAGIIEYEELFRNNEQYESQDFYFEGEVVQVIERRNDEYDFRIRIGRVLNDEIIYLSGYKGQRLLESDPIEFVGKSKGLHSYSAILGNRVTLPELEALAIRLATNQSADGGGLDAAGRTKENPIPFGESGMTNDGLSLSIMDVIGDAEDMILAENQFNDPAPEGRQFVIVTIKVRNDTSETQRYRSYGLNVVGQSNVGYDAGDCGVIPDAFDSSRNMFSGGELSGNVCFNVESSDVDSLVMYDSNAYDSSDWVFFALR